MTLRRSARNKVTLVLKEQDELIETDEDHDNSTYTAIINTDNPGVTEEHVKKFGEFQNIFLKFVIFILF